MNNISEHLFFAFPAILEFLLDMEKISLQVTCQSLQSLITSCGHWQICELPCVSNVPKSIPPNNFTFCDHIYIQHNNQQYVEVSGNEIESFLGVPELESESESESDYVSLDECVYASLYLDHCSILSTSYGWGLFAHKTIPALTPLITYTGELISNEETEHRQRVYDSQVNESPRHSDSSAKKLLRTPLSFYSPTNAHELLPLPISLFVLCL